MHGRQKNRCKECGGTGICIHRREKAVCKGKYIYICIYIYIYIHMDSCPASPQGLEPLGSSRPSHPSGRTPIKDEINV